MVAAAVSPVMRLRHVTEFDFDDTHVPDIIVMKSAMERIMPMTTFDFDSDQYYSTTSCHLLVSSAA